MANRYTHDGIPSDLLTSERFDTRRLKVENQTVSPSAKTFTYDLNGNLDTIITVDSNTGKAMQTQFTYTDGTITGISVTEV